MENRSYRTRTEGGNWGAPPGDRLADRQAESAAAEEWASAADSGDTVAAKAGAVGVAAVVAAEAAPHQRAKARCTSCWTIWMGRQMGPRHSSSRSRSFANAEAATPLEAGIGSGPGHAAVVAAVAGRSEERALDSSSIPLRLLLRM